MAEWTAETSMSIRSSRNLRRFGASCLRCSVYSSSACLVRLSFSRRCSDTLTSPFLTRFRSRRVRGEPDSEALLGNGSEGDSSPARRGALGLPEGVGSELPPPCSSSWIFLLPTPATLTGREFLCVGIALGPPRGPTGVDLRKNGSPDPLCYHKNPIPFCVPDGFGHASLRMDACTKLHPQENKHAGR